MFEMGGNEGKGEAIGKIDSVEYSAVHISRCETRSVYFHAIKCTTSSLFRNPLFSQQNQD